MYEITPVNVLTCVCDLPECIGDGKPWTSNGEPWINGKPTLPKRCRWCKAHRWNGIDQRRKKDKVYSNLTEEEMREYNRKKQADSRTRKKEEAKERERLIAAQLAKSKSKPEIKLPKPKKVKTSDAD